MSKVSVDRALLCKVRALLEESHFNLYPKQYHLSPTAETNRMALHKLTLGPELSQYSKLLSEALTKP